MIWFAVRVPPQKEFIAEQILRERFRANGVQVQVPITHVVRKLASVNARRAIRARPIMPGVVWLGVSRITDLPLVELSRMSIIQGFMMGEQGAPMMFRDADIIRIFGDMHQRPGKLLAPLHKSKRKPGSSLEIVDGPYAGRIARVQCRDSKVSWIVVTALADWFRDLTVDTPHNISYLPQSDAPLAVSAPRGDCSKGGPAARGSDREHCVPNPRKRCA